MVVVLMLFPALNGINTYRLLKQSKKGTPYVPEMSLLTCRPKSKPMSMAKLYQLHVPPCLPVTPPARMSLWLGRNALAICKYSKPSGSVHEQLQMIWIWISTVKKMLMKLWVLWILISET
jgi:hypothetical protein